MGKLKEFRIEKLFGYKNVNLKFENDILILMGENGTGKTSILNALYFTLTKKWNKLSKVNFETISIKFENRSFGSVEFSFDKTDVLDYIEVFDRFQDTYVSELIFKVKEIIDFEELKRFIESQNPKDDIHSIIQQFIRKNRYFTDFDIPTRQLVDIVYLINKKPDVDTSYSFFEFFYNIIDNTIDNNILYFPTYRRVEEELHYLGKIEDIMDRFGSLRFYRKEREEFKKLEEETLIRFGMRDVEERIQKSIAEIKESSASGFSKVSGDILKQLQDGFPEVDYEKINKDEIEIILNRIQSNNLPQNDKDNIKQLLNTNKIEEKKELAYFLIQLQNIYSEQKELDNSIKNFVRVVNEYLVDKHFIFDESNVNLQIYNKHTDDIVELSQLSSGEKQIVSLFSKLYLEKRNDYMIFFDEPELSLSIKWQQKLLPHIIDSKKCDFLLAVTHSPFIFKNGLEGYTMGLNTFID
ncbi:AAA family ATPase [Capnocytophaga cynodegmi]|uniref:AAA family ATPase n=1 Tax=Capnocytophaga cynodegmi TaxID=28189 RepID=UPI00385A9F53